MPLHHLLRHVPDNVVVRLSHPTATTAFIVWLTLWLSLVRVFRWRRYNAIHRKYGSKWNNGLGELLPQEAQEIIQVSKLYDMPWLLYHTYALALFKTYGIVSPDYFEADLVLGFHDISHSLLFPNSSQRPKSSNQKNQLPGGILM